MVTFPLTEKQSRKREKNEPRKKRTFLKNKKIIKCKKEENYISFFLDSPFRLI